MDLVKMATPSYTQYLAPPADEYIRNMSSLDVGLTATCGAFTLLTLGIFADQLFYVFRYLGAWPLRFHVAFLLSVYSIYSLLSMVTLFVPRSLPINDIISGLYISIGLYIFVRLLVGNYGSTSKMMERLIGEPMKLRTSPICCCLFCLPTVTLTRIMIFVLEGSVLQYGILRPILGYVQAVMLAEKLGEYDPNAIYSRGLIQVISTLVAMYGLQLLYSVSINPLRHIPLKAKFRCLQLVLVLDNMQSSLFTYLGSQEVIPPQNGLSSEANGYRIHRMITVLEMFLLSIVARIYYRKHMVEVFKAACTFHIPRSDSIRSTVGIIANDDVEANHEEAITEQPPTSSNGYCTANGNVVRIHQVQLQRRRSLIDPQEEVVCEAGGSNLVATPSDSEGNRNVFSESEVVLDEVTNVDPLPLMTTGHPDAVRASEV